MIVRWVAVGIVEAVTGFGRLKGCVEMPKLVASAALVINRSDLSPMKQTSHSVERQLSRR